jgi:hypothetical protein
VAFVRAIHLAPAVPAVSVFVNGQGPVWSGLSFQGGTAYAALDEGTYTVQIVGPGAGPANPLLTVPGLSVVGDTRYTVAAYAAVGGAAALALVDDYTSVPDGAVRVRAVHVAGGVGTVNILANSQVLFADLPFGSASSFADVPAAAYTVGIDTNDNGTAELNCAVPALAEGSVFNLFAVQAQGQVRLVAQDPVGNTASILCQPATPSPSGCGNGQCAPAESCSSCPADCGVCQSSNCCSAKGSPGCNLQACAQAVCAVDPFCCQTAWDSLCATCAQGGPGVSGANCGPAALACGCP